mgnify:CR=1 FL=1
MSNSNLVRDKVRDKVWLLIPWDGCEIQQFLNRFTCIWDKVQDKVLDKVLTISMFCFLDSV